MEQLAKQDATEQQFGELLRNSPKGACDCEKLPYESTIKGLQKRYFSQTRLELSQKNAYY